MADDPGDGVKGEQLLFELPVFVDTEFDAVAGQKLIDCFTVLDQSVHKPFLQKYKRHFSRILRKSAFAPYYFTIPWKNSIVTQSKSEALFEKMYDKNHNSPVDTDFGRKSFLSK